jgi:hypothetical protein
MQLNPNEGISSHFSRSHTALQLSIGRSMNVADDDDDDGKYSLSCSSLLSIDVKCIRFIV